MPPKKETIHEQTSLLAIFLADTFDSGFEPVSLETASVLFPVVNVPLIEYSLEWLAANEVNEVLVLCCRHVDAIVTYLEASKWSPDSTFMKVRPIVGQDCHSIGDALRFIDQLHIVKSDCVVLKGNIISNMNLKEAVQAHRNRRQRESTAILTVTMTEGHHSEHRLRLGVSASYCVLDGETHRLLKYKEMPLYEKPSTFEFDASFFSERDVVHVHTDLMDAEVYVCAPEVLMLFTENFDYQNIRKDFITNVLSEEELGNKIYLHRFPKAYAQHIENMRSYDAISRDVLGRWTYPFSPDTRIFTQALNGTTFDLLRGQRYFAEHSSLPLDVQMEGSLCIGPDISIHKDAIISQSVIGKRCHIDKESKIQGSYVQDNVHIGRNVEINGSLLCSGCVVHDHAVINEGCVLSFGVVIGARHTVPAYSRISLCAPIDIKSSDDMEGTTDTSFAVSEGQTMERVPEKKALDAAETLRELGTTVRYDRPAYFDNAIVGKSGAGSKWSSLSSSTERIFSISQPSLKDFEEIAEKENASSEDGDSSSAGSSDPDQAFEKEVVDTFLRCVHEKFSKENVILELNGLKLAEMRSFVECANYIFTTLLQMCMPSPNHVRPIYRSLFSDRMLDLSQNSDQSTFLKSLQSHLQEWSPVLVKFLKDEDDQVELMFTFEEFFKGEGVFQRNSWHGQLGPLIAKICQLLYDEDIVTEDAFLSWAQEKEKATDAEDQIFYQRAKVFIDWLKEAEETDSE